MGFGIYLSDINGARGRVDQISLWAALTPSGLRRCATRSKCFAFCEPHRFKSKDSSFKLAWAEVFISRILMVPGPDLIKAYKQLLYIVNLNIYNTYTVKSTVIFYFHDPKTPTTKSQFSDTPTPPRGYPHFFNWDS